MTELNEITKIGQRITKDTAEHQHHVGIKNDSGFLPLTVILMNFNTCLWERNIYALLASRIWRFLNLQRSLDSNWVGALRQQPKFKHLQIEHFSECFSEYSKMQAT